MTQDEVKLRLVEVLSDIQSTLGQEVTIDGSTCPAADLEGFDSQVWPVATGELAAKLNVEIPNDLHIFITQDRKRKLTVDEVTARVYKIIEASHDEHGR